MNQNEGRIGGQEKKKSLYIGSRRRAVMQYLRVAGYAQLHQIAYTLGASPTTVYDDLVAMKKAALVDDFSTTVRIVTSHRDGTYRDAFVRVWALTSAGARRHQDAVAVPGSDLVAARLDAAPIDQVHATLRHKLLINEHLLLLEVANHEVVHERVIVATEKPDVRRRFQETELSWESRVARQAFWLTPARGRIESDGGHGDIKTRPMDDISCYVPDGAFVAIRPTGTADYWAIEIETSTKAALRYRERVLAARGKALAHASSGQRGLVYFGATAEIRQAIVRAITVHDEQKRGEGDPRLIPGQWVDHDGGTWRSDDKRTVIQPLLTDVIADVPARKIPRAFNLDRHPLDWKHFAERPRSVARSWEVRPDMTARATDPAVQAKARATRAAQRAGTITEAPAAVTDRTPGAPSPAPLDDATIRTVQAGIDGAPLIDWDKARKHAQTAADEANSAQAEGIDVTALHAAWPRFKAALEGQDAAALPDARRAVDQALQIVHAEGRARAQVAARQQRSAAA
jgi:hypothetical protein